MNNFGVYLNFLYSNISFKCLCSRHFLYKNNSDQIHIAIVKKEEGNKAVLFLFFAVFVKAMTLIISTFCPQGRFKCGTQYGRKKRSFRKREILATR